jgi:hypothetical protein
VITCRDTPLGAAFFGSVATPTTVKNILRQAYANSAAVTDELVDCILKPGLEVRLLAGMGTRGGGGGRQGGHGVEWGGGQGGPGGGGQGGLEWRGEGARKGGGAVITQDLPKEFVHVGGVLRLSHANPEAVTDELVDCILKPGLKPQVPT